RPSGFWGRTAFVPVPPRIEYTKAFNLTTRCSIAEHRNNRGSPHGTGRNSGRHTTWTRGQSVLRNLLFVLQAFAHRRVPKTRRNLVFFLHAWKGRVHYL